tara:strand:+ start:161 stop:640 length:480 start_codon:yes stop_codon:yes gene_type:complete
MVVAKKYKLDLSKVLIALSKRDYTFYDTLTDVEKEGFSPFILVKYCSSIVSGDENRVVWNLVKANEVSNAHLFDFAKHPKLQWLLLVAANLPDSRYKFEWIKQAGKKSATTDKGKALAKLFPIAKMEDIELMTQKYTDKDIKNYVRDLGYETTKEFLKS